MWFAPAFVYERGSHNWKVLARTLDMSSFAALGREISTDDSAETSTIYADGVGLKNNITILNAPTLSGDKRLRLNTFPNCGESGAGHSVTNTDINASLQVSCPLYSQYRAISTFPPKVNAPRNSRIVAGANVGETTLALFSGNGRDFVHFRTQLERTPTYLRTSVYHSCGPDFSLLFYRGCPVLYQYTATPLPPV